MWKVTYFTYNNYLYIDLFKLLFTIINTTLCLTVYNWHYWPSY